MQGPPIFSGATYLELGLSVTYAMENEQRLIKRVIAGDRQAFLTLIERYQRLVQHVVYRMVSDERDREELCQDVFMKVYRNLDGFRGDAKLSTWIATIARNTCLNHLEKKDLLLYEDEASPSSEEDDRSALARLPGETRGPAEHTAREEVHAFIHDEIKKLPEHYRTALTLYHLEGMSVQEVSEVMDNPTGTVKSHLYRARKKLKDRLLATYSPEELQS